MASTARDDTWQHGHPYERYVGRWSRRVAPEFLAWLALPPGLRWVDVGCGTGALSEAIADTCTPAAVTGVEPSEGFLRLAHERLDGRATLAQASAAQLPLDDASVDAAVSALVLNFVPDPLAALGEMVRVTTAHGTVAAYVWDYAEGMQLMRHFWDAATALDPQALPLDEGRRFPLCRQEALADLFVRAGLLEIEVSPLDIATLFTSFDDYWQPFLGGQGPAPTYVAGLSDDAREHLREALQARLPPQADGSIELMARAWGVRGVVPARL
ncbi:class I SAM-dependent methyltransferase [Sphaerotilaceae bacterium SBD11-9]